jgi:hypothetical protein
LAIWRLGDLAISDLAILAMWADRQIGHQIAK